MAALLEVNHAAARSRAQECMQGSMKQKASSPLATATATATAKQMAATHKTLAGPASSGVLYSQQHPRVQGHASIEIITLLTVLYVSIGVMTTLEAQVTKSSEAQRTSSSAGQIRSCRATGSRPVTTALIQALQWKRHMHRVAQEGQNEIERTDKKVDKKLRSDQGSLKDLSTTLQHC